MKRPFGRLLGWANRGQRGIATAKAEQDLRAYLECGLAGGFLSPEDLTQAALEYDDAIDPAIAAPIIARVLPELIRAKLASQTHWPSVTDCDRLDQAFAKLTKAGIVARQDFTCCTKCGSAEIGEEMQNEKAMGVEVRGYTFYHQQNTEAAVEGQGLHLAYGATDANVAAALAVAAEIVATLAQHGLVATWDGTTAQKIGVQLDWKRRLVP